ncbi:HAD family hydrolase [Chloroflexota bacterium]
MQKKIKPSITNVGFIWDIDGVVVDSPHEDAWRITAIKEPWNVSELSSEFYFTHVASRPRYEGGQNILEMKGVYERLGAKTADEKDILLDKFCTEKNNLIKDLITAGEFRLFPDAITLLLEAKSMGIKQAAASASKNACDMLTRVSRARIVEEMGNDFGVLAESDTLLSVFEINACGLDLNNKADMQELAAAQLNTLFGGSVKRFVVFEDAPAGILAAKSLGYYAVGVLRIGHEDALYQAGAAIIVRDLKTLKIEELLSK